MSKALPRSATEIVGLLVMVEVASVFILWNINAVSKAGEGEFAIFLAIDLISLAMISNIYRSGMQGDQLNKGFLGVCLALILIFVLFGLAI